MAKKILVCGTCNSDFEYSINEYNRQTKKGRSVFYCSLSCASKRKSNIEHLSKNREKFNLNFKGGENKLMTEEDIILSSMRKFLSRVKYRVKDSPSKYLETDLTIEYLSDLWKLQKGKCIYTKVNLILPSSNLYSKSNANYKASIDRVNSNVGYIKGNVQFISFSCNNLKMAFREDVILEFIKNIKNMEE